MDKFPLSISPLKLSQEGVLQPLPAAAQWASRAWGRTPNGALPWPHSQGRPWWSCSLGLVKTFLRRSWHGNQCPQNHLPTLVSELLCRPTNVPCLQPRAFLLSCPSHMNTSGWLPVPRLHSGWLTACTPLYSGWVTTCTPLVLGMVDRLYPACTPLYSGWVTACTLPALWRAASFPPVNLPAIQWAELHLLHGGQNPSLGEGVPF